MKFAAKIVALALALIPALASAQLSREQRIVAHVPFDFMVANKIVPAGNWIVQSATLSGGTLIVRNTEARKSLFATTSMDQAKQPAGSYALVFHRYGGQYFLAGIKLAGDRTMYRVHESKAEAEIRAQNVPGTESLVAAALQ